MVAPLLFGSWYKLGIPIGIFSAKKFLKSLPAQTITCSFMLYQENIPASCVVSFCVPTGCMVPHFSRDGHLTDGKFSGVIQTCFAPWLAKHAFFSDYSVLPVCWITPLQLYKINNGWKSFNTRTIESSPANRSTSCIRRVCGFSFRLHCVWFFRPFNIRRGRCINTV